MIVDASVAFKWLMVEEGSELAAALVGSGRLIAPDLIASELANAMWKKCARNQLSAVPDAFARVLDLFDTIEPTAPLMSRATEIALSLNHPAYDCFYLATAELHDDHVVTADLRFLHKLRGSQWAATALSLEDWAHWKGLG